MIAKQPWWVVDVGKWYGNVWQYDINVTSKYNNICVFSVRRDCETKTNKSSAEGGAIAYGEKKGIDGKVILWGNFWPQKKREISPPFSPKWRLNGAKSTFFFTFFTLMNFYSKFLYESGKNWP